MDPGPIKAAPCALDTRRVSFAEAIVHGSQEAIFILDPQRDFRMAFVNDAACRHFRLTRDELMAMSPPDWDPRVSMDGLRAMWQTRTGTGVPFVIETTHRRGDGTLVPVEIFGSVLQYDGQAYALGSIRDVTVRKQIEESLRESEERFRELFEQSEDLICTHDLEGRLRTVNPKAAELLGYTVSSLIGMKLVDLLAPETRGSVAAYLVRIRERGFDKGVMRVLTAAGEKRIWEYHNTLKTAGVAEPIVRGMAHDVTVRQAAVEALHESEERLRLALQAANQGLFDLNVQTGVAQVSPEYATMLGYDPAEFHETNSSWLERLHPDDREPVGAMYRAYVEGKTPEYRVEFRQRTRSGGWKWILSLGRIVERDRAGAPLRMLGTHTDITERKHTELALEHEASRRRVLFEQATDGIVVVDERCAVVEANASFARMLGYELDDVRSLHTWDWDTRYTSADAALAASAECPDAPATVEVRLRRRDGTMFDAEISQTPARWSDQRLLFYVCRDITERRRSEIERARLQAELVHAQKMECVGRLAGGVAHDFNNMLSVILGYSDLALAQLDAAHPLRTQLQEIQGAATRSADLTRQLLAFSRRQTASPRVLDLNDAVTGGLKMIRRLIGEDIELAWRPGGGLWAVNIDPSQVDQVLLNLAVNARDAIHGVGQITIATENVRLESWSERPVGLPPGDYVRLTVQDNGCGISPEMLEHLFEPFYTTKPVGQGTGLGLATVYGIVQQNSGFIDVTSAPGRGAAFKIFLPRAIPEAQPDAAHNEVSRRAAAQGRGRTVLLVEDEPSILRLGQAVLQSLGYNVLAAATPSEGLEIGTSHPGRIDLLLTDVIMPGMNGRELADHLTAIRPDLRCLFMSGYMAEVIAHRGILNEGVQYLQKPFSRHDLAQKVRETLEVDVPLRD